jgi:hypothetical protein
MARTALQQWVVPTAARASATTFTSFLPVPYDILIKGVHVFGINPAAADADTVRVIVDHSAVGAGTFTVVADTTADEYNDTDDTASLGTGATDGDIRSVGAADWGTLTFPGTRVAGNRYLRCRDIWTGTVTDGQVQVVVSYEVLNDTDDSD